MKKIENTLKREEIINAVYSSSIDYIPVLIEPNYINRTIVVDRITLTSVLKENVWEYDFVFLWGWGYETPVLQIKTNDFLFKSIKYKSIKNIEIFLPKESFINLNYTDFSTENIPFDEIDDSLIRIDDFLEELGKLFK